MIISEIDKFDVSIEVIPNGLEKYMSFNGLQLSLVKQKGVNPYEYVDSFDKFDKCELPSKKKIYSSLKGKEISNKDYARSKKVWKAFKMKNLGDYHDLYLKTDVLLLCDVFEKFISVYLTCYRLDPAHYFSLPGSSWDAMLKMTGVTLEHIRDINLYLFREKGMVGGTSHIANRYSKANNKYTGDYNPDDDTKYIMYFDANSLYRWPMMQYLPYGGFRFLSSDEIEKFDISSLSETSEGGYILEVDLEYPNELHNLHDDYPLAPNKINVTEDMLSDYCGNIAKEHNISVGGVKKVVPNFKKREKYITHYRNLKIYVSLGLKLVEIH